MYFGNEKIKRIVEKEWLNTMHIRQNIFLDEFVVMPNHLHGIIVITHHVGAYCNTPLQNQFKSPSKTIGAIIRGFKSSTTKQINLVRNIPRAPIWQRNYYDHIIRDEDKLNKIKKYIRNNPLKWSLDRENPRRMGTDVLEDKIFNQTPKRSEK